MRQAGSAPITSTSLPRPMRNVPPDQFPELIKSLLVERFKLAAHIESRELQVYALILARSDGKLGPGLRPASAECAATIAARGRGGPPVRAGPGGSGRTRGSGWTGCNRAWTDRPPAAGPADAVRHDALRSRKPGGRRRSHRPTRDRPVAVGEQNRGRQDRVDRSVRNRPAMDAQIRCRKAAQAVRAARLLVDRHFRPSIRMGPPFSRQCRNSLA